MNKTATILPIIAALVKSEDGLGAYRIWHPINDTQSKFLENYFPKRAELINLSPNELRSWIDTNAAKLNEILQREGFSIELDEFGKDEFGTVSILDVLVEWIFEGQATTFSARKGGNHPGVLLENKSGFVSFVVANSPAHQHPIASVSTKSGDTVFMTVAESQMSDFELLAKINRIESTSSPMPAFDTLTFPMINLNETVDISWIQGMYTASEIGPGIISQALQQTKFKMNEKGARAKSAVAMAVMRSISSPKRHIVIDRPFFLWITRPGMSLPLFAAYLDETVWSNPGNLDL